MFEERLVGTCWRTFNAAEYENLEQPLVNVRQKRLCKGKDDRAWNLYQLKDGKR